MVEVKVTEGDEVRTDGSAVKDKAGVDEAADIGVTTRDAATVVPDSDVLDTDAVEKTDDDADRDPTLAAAFWLVPFR